MQIHPQEVQGMSKQMQTHQRKTKTIKTNNNKGEGIVLKGHPLSSDRGALLSMYGRDGKTMTKCDNPLKNRDGLHTL
jgi:hypothetical protein